MWILTSIGLILLLILGWVLLPIIVLGMAGIALVLVVFLCYVLGFAGAAIVFWNVLGCYVLGGTFKTSGAPESVYSAMCSPSALYIAAFIGAIFGIYSYIEEWRK